MNAEGIAMLNNLIQLGVLFVLFATLVVIWRQLTLQKKLVESQIATGWFEMYWKTTDGPTDDEIRSFSANATHYMSSSAFARYKEDQAIIRYIDTSKIYEFLALYHYMEQQHVGAPFGNQWAEEWIQDMLKGGNEFLDVDDYYGRYYPQFHQHVQSIIERRSAASAMQRPSASEPE